jgi:hypothetical protein
MCKIRIRISSTILTPVIQWTMVFDYISSSTKDIKETLESMSKQYI